MLLPRNSVCGLVVVLTLWLGILLHAQDHSATKSTAKSSAAGKPLFTTDCAGCHGLDGRGAERAPNIASNPRIQRLSDSQLGGIISNGISGTGMPAFHTLTDEQVRAIVEYLRTLQGGQQAQPLPGDGVRGKEIFFGKGECSSCHMISGTGGFLGPDLSTYAANLTVNAIQQGIVGKDRIVPAGYRTAVATTRDGKQIEGIVRNEDNFSVQLQSRDGGFHFLQKADLQNFEFLTAPLMPTNYSERLTQNELNDLMSYLITASSQGKNKDSKKREGDSE